MKYTIIINQKALQKIAPELDLIDAAILDYLIHWCAADRIKAARITMESDGHSQRFTWINYTQLIKELPILKIKTKGAISRRITKIEKSGFIETTKEPGKPRAGRLFVRLTKKIRDLFFERGVATGQRKGLPQNNEGLPQNNIHHINKDNNNILSPKGDNSLILDKKKDSRIKEVIDFFFETCHSIKGFQPRISGAIEGKMIKNYLKDYSVEDLTDELSWFLNSDESKKLGCTIKVALSAFVFNKWLAQRETYHP